MKTIRKTILLGLGALLSLAAPSVAQGPTFSSPGLSPYSTMGQTNRFSTEFNPSFGFVVDGYLDYLAADAGDDGYDIALRLMEFNAAAFVDPKAWAYVVLTSENLESPEVEEAAVEYIGFEGNSTVKVGRMFVDFGKTMQTHLEELRTLERPLPLREFLGEELAGTGVQYDNWFAAGEETPVRFSLGVFASLLGEGHHEEEEGEEEPEGEVPDRKDIDELSITARLTGMTDVGDNAQLQVGASARIVPEFSFAFDTLEEEGLSNTVVGVDVTYGGADDTGNRTWTVGGEYLIFEGDLAAEVDDPMTPTTLTVVDDTAHGFYFFADYAWDQANSAGIQYAMVEEAEDPDEDVMELDAYWTHHFTEFRRLRLGVTYADSDEEDESVRFYVQFTSFFGSHSHGLNW